MTRKRNEKKRNRKDKGASNIYDAISSGLLAVDEDNKITVCNTAAGMIIGQAGEQLIGARLANLAAFKQAVRHISRARRRSVTINRAEWAAGKPRTSGSATVQGEERTFGGNICPIFDAAGKVTTVVLLFQDITASLALDRGFSESERLLAVFQSVAKLAHEARNPLNSIRGYAQHLLSRLDDPQLSRSAQVIMDEADKLNKLFVQLHQQQRELGTPARGVDLPELLAEIGKELPMELHWEIEENLPRVKADRRLLRQLLGHFFASMKKSLQTPQPPQMTLSCSRLGEGERQVILTVLFWNATRKKPKTARLAGVPSRNSILFLEGYLKRGGVQLREIEGSKSHALSLLFPIAEGELPYETNPADSTASV